MRRAQAIVSFAARLAVSLTPLALASGCGPFNEAVGTLAGIDTVVSVPVFGRSMGDMVYSAASGRDCSIVRLGQGKRYCAPREGPPDTTPFCTRSLGVVDCWADPRILPDRQNPVAEAPTLTREQEADRTARWPKL